MRNTSTTFETVFHAVQSIGTTTTLLPGMIRPPLDTMAKSLTRRHSTIEIQQSHTETPLEEGTQPPEKK
jgi:hypothetical protein